MMRNYTVGTERQPVVAALFSPDLNNDGCIDLKDYDLLKSAIRSRSVDSKYDINQDGIVNSSDLRKLVLLYTNPNGAACL